MIECLRLYITKNTIIFRCFGMIVYWGLAYETYKFHGISQSYTLVILYLSFKGGSISKNRKKTDNIV